MLTVKNLEKSYGPLTVLSGVSFVLSRGQKVALVGPNGVGKTTLLKILAGVEESDEGKVELSRNTLIGYLPQDTGLTGDETVTQYLEKTTGIAQLEREMKKMSSRLTDPVKKKHYEEALDQYEHLEGYTFSNRMDAVLSGFDLGKEILTRPLNQLSSGQKSKVILAGILLKGVDLLLLDEPTNNLDLPTLIWLEDYLMRLDVACLIISHDRQFLDRVVHTIFELDSFTHNISISNGKYTSYLQLKIKELEAQKEAFQLQQEEIERLTEAARKKQLEAKQGSHWISPDNDKVLQGFKRERAGRSSKTAKAIEKRIEQMEKVERPVEKGNFEINLDIKKEPGTLNLTLDDVVAGYDDQFSIGPCSLEIRFGERVAIIGPNGSGKSTLLKTITSQLKPKSGEISIGSGIRIGNMMQEHQTLPKDQSPLDYLKNNSQLNLTDAFTKLVQFGFNELTIRQPIARLSPGGRARLILAQFSATSVNLLVLDEPTNHLDIEALDALERTISNYKGSILLVSHDRYLLEQTKLDYTYLLDNGRLTRVSLPEYLEDAEQRSKRLLKLL